MIGFLNRIASRISTSRPPNIEIGGHDRPYLRRWFVIPRNRWFNIYLHQFVRSDDDKALHDHPWINCSILIRGTYVEHRIADGGVHHRTRRTAGDIVLRLAKSAHRIEIDSGEAWTLFLTGPAVRSWGFHCPNGWVHWRDFTNPADGGATIGRGCGDS
jgi:hypothetical protein